MILLISGCDDPGPKISGHPASYWIERLTDVDRETSYGAYQKLRLASPENLKPSKKLLRKAADEGAEDAPWLLLDKFNEIDVKWVDTYVDAIAFRGADVLNKLDKNETHSAIVDSLEAMKASGMPKKRSQRAFGDEIQKNKDAAALYLKKMGYNQPEVAQPENEPHGIKIRSLDPH